MLPYERTYRGRPTKWAFIRSFYELKREVWNPIRLRQQEMLCEGRITIQAYKVEQNLEADPEWKWLQGKLDVANATSNPTGHLNQINIYRLENAVKHLHERAIRIANWNIEQTNLALEETVGHKENTRYNISLAERESVIENEEGFVATEIDD